MSTPTPDIETLLRLKRHESPPPGYFDDFVEAFRERQRAEVLRVSAWRLLADRAGAALHEWRFLLQPRWLYPIGAAYTLLMIGLFFRQSKPTSSVELAEARQNAAVGAIAAARAHSPVRTVGVHPLPTGSSSSPMTVGAIPVSMTASPTADSRERPNGLRRTPQDAFIPLLSTPSSDQPSTPAAANGQVIILVR